MELTFVQSLRVRMPDGPQAFEVGQILELPDKVALRLMELAPGKVRLVNHTALHIGQRVRYRVPVHITGPKRHTWEEHVGLVEMIDQDQHLALIIPEDETIPWRWMNLSLIHGSPSN